MMRKLAIGLSSVAIVIVMALACSGAAQAQEHDPDKAKIHEQRAKAARDLQDWNLTAAEYQKAYEYDPQPKYLFNIGLASDLAGEREQALLAFRAYLAKEPRGTYAVTARTKIDELEAAIAREKQEAEAAKLAEHLRDAESYRDAGRHDAAAFEYNQAYELTQNGEYLFEAAESYRMVGSTQQAVDTYEAYLAAEPAGKFAISARKHLDELEQTSAATTEPKPADLTTLDLPSTTEHGMIESAPRKKKTKWLWVAAGAAEIAAGFAADTIPSAGSNGTFDGTDLVPVGLYGLGITAVVVGVF